ncbi:hypothetical protein EOD39_6342 [Acipenser ruthenus]|uniref:Uncharacterized protein n=1 Tax=Acipenser ruthenus TaxID=7906 RepID=A0A444UAG9_ACIRT|nr:hypothetical protein EOD39_6342 [Acipenser ruthenus]
MTVDPHGRRTTSRSGMAALTNGWGPTEKAGQLAAALEGEALQALLDLCPDEVAQYKGLTTALECRFGRVEPAVGLRLQLTNHIIGPGEKLGILAADVRYLAQRRYHTFPPATQENLAAEAFVRGLTPTALRQQVRLAAPTSLELTVAHAERVEVVLEEGEQDRAAGSERGQSSHGPSRGREGPIQHRRPYLACGAYHPHQGSNHPASSDS